MGTPFIVQFPHSGYNYCNHYSGECKEKAFSLWYSVYWKYVSCWKIIILITMIMVMVMPLFEGYSMVLFKKAVLWFWMDNLVAHFTIRLSFRVSSDLCHMDTEWRSGTANCTAGCSKRQRGTATPAGLHSAVVLTCNDIGLDTCKGHNWREE